MSRAIFFLSEKGMIIHKLSEKMIGEWRMKRLISKILAGIGITIVAIPVLLIALFVVIEVVGNVANKTAFPECLTVYHKTSSD